MKWAILGIMGLIVLPAMLAVFVLLGRGCAAPANMANRALTVAQEELDPRTLLNRYMWFKNAAAAMDKKRADISMYEDRLAQFNAQFQGKDMPRYAMEQQSLWATEMLGVKSSYNSLAAEYNAAMAKINWRFTNLGSLPAGATEVLPKEYAAYVSR